MKLHGYCTSCHKVKRVRVTNQAMAMYSVQRVLRGICDACQQEADDKRKAQR